MDYLGRAMISVWVALAAVAIAVLATATATHLFDASAHYGKHAQCTPVTVARLQDNAVGSPDEGRPSVFPQPAIDAGDAPTAPLLLPITERGRCLPWPVQTAHPPPPDSYGRHGLRENRSGQ